MAGSATDDKGTIVLRDKHLLATDLDGTFIGDDDAMVTLWERLLDRDVLVAFSTGRHLPSITNFYEEKHVPYRADYCICMVGTDIHFRTGDAYVLDRAWHEHIGQEWDKGAVEEILHNIPEARMQDAQWQSPFKSSYYLEENAAKRLDEIHAKLEAQGIQAKVVYSADKFLDLLPARSGKGEAVRYVSEKLGVPAENVVTSGDTGNDLDMMRSELGFRCIAVGNAAPELKSFQAEHVYHANAPYAAGIHEGLKHYGWL
jgi:sucrose-phosphate synthase